MALLETWRWNEESFVRAWEAGVFRDERVELVEGEVWPVSIGVWRGTVVGNVARSLPNGEWRLTMASLPASGSVPDPDLWVHHRDVTPVARLGATGRLARWNPSDVALVVEIADTSLEVDRDVKSLVYGRASFPVYWVVHRGGVDVFGDPCETGYRRHEHVPADGRLEVPYRSGTFLDVATLLDAEE
jgi:hypothetical protein